MDIETYKTNIVKPVKPQTRYHITSQDNIPHNKDEGNDTNGPHIRFSELTASPSTDDLRWHLRGKQMYIISVRISVSMLVIKYVLKTDGNKVEKSTQRNV